MKEKQKKVLFFAPYGTWTVHHQVDAVLGAALKLRGCEICVVGCNAIFEKCPIAGDPPDKRSCQNCMLAGREIFSKFGLPVTYLGTLLEQKDIQQCREWSNNVQPSDLLHATFEEAKIGEWAYASMCQYCLSGNIDLSKQNVVNKYRNLLYNGALLKRAFLRQLDIFSPDHLVCYSGLHFYYQAALKLARERGIPVLVHERGMSDGSFSFDVNHMISRGPEWTNAWQAWKDVPLDTKEISQAKQLFDERVPGKNRTNMPSFYTFMSDEKDVRKKLRIPPDASIICLFTSSDWEYAMEKEGIEKSFNSQIDVILRAIDSFARDNTYLVIRHHPHMAYKNILAVDFLEMMFKLNRQFPENVRVIMPNERLTSYEIIWQADAAITAGSSVGPEAVARGVAAACTINNIYTALDIGVEMVKSSDQFTGAVERAVGRTKNYKIDDLRRLYRGAYFLYYRLSRIFKSFGIHDTYLPDIRIKDIGELASGNDKSLDEICDHIMFNGPLYPVPDEKEKIQSNEAETEFCEKELHFIQQKRMDVRENSMANKNYKEPLVTIVRIRQDGVAWPENTVLRQMIKKSRHKKIEYIEMPFPYYVDTAMFLQELAAAANVAEGEFVYFGTDNTHIDESFFSTAVDFLGEPANENYDGVVTGAWICDKNGNLINEIFTERKDTDNYTELVEILPLVKNLVQLLTFFVWRKSSLLNLVTYLKNCSGLFQDIASTIFDMTLSENPVMKLNKTLVPAVTIYMQSNSDELVTDGIGLFNDKKYEEALALFDRVQRIDPKIQGVGLCRALTKANLGQLWEAKVIIEASLIKTPTDIEAKKLLSEISQELQGKDLQYEDIALAVDSVQGWLVVGQEKFLFDKVKSLPDGAKILEVGSFVGRSTSAMAFACVGTNKRIFSIDTFVGMVDGGTKVQGNTFFDRWKSNITRLGLSQYITPLQGFSNELLANWGEESKFDFAFIDGSHHYADVLNDFELVYRLVKDGGWIALHDVEPGWEGPWRVWQETAMPLLSSHQSCSTIACGRKDSSRVSVKPSLQSTFDHRKTTDFLADQVPQLSEAINLSYQEHVQGLEREGSKLLEPVAESMEVCMGHEISQNVPLRKNRSISIEPALSIDRMAEENFPTQVLGIGTCQAPIEADPESIYDEKYFAWQKDIGIFGGVANLFKFVEFIQPTDVVVDFGCGGGYLLNNVNCREKIGIEINQHARKEASSQGIYVFDDIDALENEVADVIISNHALEHVDCPLDVLISLRSKLKIGGKIIFVIPHQDVKEEYNPADKSHHLYTWNQMTLGNLFVRARYKVLRSEAFQHQWPPNYADIYSQYGEEKFHQICREYAIANNNYQIRTVATMDSIKELKRE